MVSLVRNFKVYKHEKGSYTNGLKNIKTTPCRTNDSTRHLRMPVHLLNVSLSHMNKQQLGRYVFQRGINVLRVPLHSQIPNRYLVIRTAGGEHRVIGGMPFKRSDWSSVVFKGCHCSIVFQLSQIPNLYNAVVTSPC